jgi:tetratricopeptide (TPR) repeat protein
MPETPLSSAILTILRLEKTWSQTELAGVLGRSSSLICLYEKGKKSLDRERLEQFAVAMGYTPESPELVRLVLLLLRELLALCQGTEEERQIALAAARVALTAARATVPALDGALAKARVRQEGEAAEDLLKELLAFPPEERSFLVAEAPEYQTAAFCVHLCAESVKAAAHRPADALGLAELAIRVARLVPGEEGGRVRLEGNCHGHRGNALRVGNDLDGAEVAFVRAWELWRAGTDAGPVPLDESRLLDLEASLRRDQRRFEEALALLELARERAGSEEQVTRVLLKKGFTLEQMGEYGRAVEALAEAELRVDGLRQPRQFWVLRFNQVVNYCHLGDRYDEAELLLPEVRALAVGLRNELDVLRTLWLTGRVHAGQGRWEEAAAALEQVRGDFTVRDLAYDAALATLELAAIRLEQGDTGEVKKLTREAQPVFRSKKIHREAREALQLFRAAVEREAVTLELARELIRYLYRARYDPRLRFAP